MEGENPEDQYGINHVETPEDVMGVDLGNGLKTKIRSSEDNPRRPFDKGKTGDDGNILNAGEKNQQSDKDENSKEGASWANRTGEKAKMAAAAASGNVGKLAKEIKKNGGIRNTAKVIGPIGTVLIIVAFCIGGFIGGQSTMLGALVGNLQGSFDPIDVAAAVRSRVLIKSIMSGKNTKGGLWSKFSDRMKAKFKKANIEVETDGEVESLKYKNAAGDDVEVDAGNFDSKYETDTDFHTQFSDGSATYNNGVGLYYDSDSKNVMDSLGVIRNSLDDVAAKEDYDETKAAFDEDTEAEFESKSKANKMSAEVDGGTEQTTEKLDPNGDPTGEYETNIDSGDSNKGKISIDSPDNADDAVSDMVRTNLGVDADGNDVGKTDFDASIVGTIANGACQLYNTATSISRMVKAYEAAQVVMMAMKVLEAIQRMQAGDGGADTLVDVVGNYLTHEKTTVFDFGGGDTATVTGSTMSSSPIAAVFGGTKLTGEDPIVKSFVTSKSQFMKIMGAMNSSVGYEACVGAQLAAGIIDAIGDGVTLGAKKLVDIVVGLAIGAGVSLIISTVTAILVPKIANALKRDFTSFLEGPEASGVLMWGSEQIMGENAKHTAMQPANPQTLTAYVKMKQEVIADRARYDRDNLSPFDTSSEHTFMGSLMRTLGKAALKTNSVVGKAGNITSIVSKSLISLTPAAHAAGVVEEIISEGDCPEINNINNDNKYASAFCTPKYISDYTTMGESPEDVMKYWSDKGAFDNYDPVSNPNPAIKPDTPTNTNELALCVEEYINRGAELGFPDSSIEEKYSTWNTGSSIADSILGAVPIVGGLIDVANNKSKLYHMGNILGYKYTEDTKQNHMCERYTLDQRMGESMGVYDKSQTAIYTENYLKEHPLDNSPLGIIARRSGLSKEEVKKDIAMINALLFVADYNSEGLGPLVIEEKKPEVVFESTENYMYIIGIIQNPARIEEKRNQNITA